MELEDALADALGREVEPAYLLDRDRRILFVNDAWDRCARGASAPDAVSAEAVLGQRWIDAISGRARRYYAALLQRAFNMELGPVPEALVHLSEANDASCARIISTQIVPLYPADSVRAAWALVTHAVVTEAPIQGRYVLSDAPEPSWRAEDGTVLQCSACRRVKLRGSTVSWEFVPPALEAKGIKWGLCRACIERYYGLPARERLRPQRAARLPRSVGLWLKTRAAAP